MLEYNSENLNSEEIYSSLRGVTEAIQNFSFRSQDDLMEPLRRDGKVRRPTTRKRLDSLNQCFPEPDETPPNVLSCPASIPELKRFSIYCHCRIQQIFTFEN